MSPFAGLSLRSIAVHGKHWVQKRVKLETWMKVSKIWYRLWRRGTVSNNLPKSYFIPLKYMYYNWRVRWKKGVTYFTQNRPLSKTLQISHAVLFRCLKQCSACFFPEACFLFEILRMRKNTFLWGHPLDLLLNEKQKTHFVSLNDEVTIIH